MPKVTKKKVERQHMTIRLPKELIRMIDIAAAEEGRSRSNQMERILKQHVGKK